MDSIYPQVLYANMNHHSCRRNRAFNWRCSRVAARHSMLYRGQGRGKLFYHQQIFWQLFKPPYNSFPGPGWAQQTRTSGTEPMSCPCLTGMYCFLKESDPGIQWALSNYGPRAHLPWSNSLCDTTRVLCRREGRRDEDYLNRKKVAGEDLYHTIR